MHPAWRFPQSVRPPAGDGESMRPSSSSRPAISRSPSAPGSGMTEDAVHNASTPTVNPFHESLPDVVQEIEL